MKAFVFPGQGSQYPAMGKELYNNSTAAKELFERANDILGFRITDIMFDGTTEELRLTNVTQPAVFLHSTILAKMLGITPDAVAGHSLGEFSALVTSGAIEFEDGLRLVSKRAAAMQRACQEQAGTMAAILGLSNDKIETICAMCNGIVVTANYNCPGQTVISGSVEAVNEACQRLKEAGTRRAITLAVGGAFHSPLMQSAREELEQAIAQVEFITPLCPIYQNVDALPYTDPQKIKENLIDQLTSPVLWEQSVNNMIANGITSFTEVGCGTVLRGLISKCSSNVEAESISYL